ncbi:hypothetical protein vseg_017148 [Gypsophila vaccaria]
MNCCNKSSPYNFKKSMLKAMTLTTIMVAVIVSPIEGKRHFYIRNEANEPVILRCQSGNEDLGYRTLGPGLTFDYGFTSLRFGHLLYFCHFYMGHMDQIFDVYSNSVSGGCEPFKNYPELPHPQCFNGHAEWVIKDDGFYKHCVFYGIKDTICQESETTFLPPTNRTKLHEWKISTFIPEV